MPDQMTRTSEGSVLITNGIDRPLLFRPEIGSNTTAGIVAPVPAPTLSGSGAGQIVGSFYAYVRFVDRDGNVSSISPISNNYEPAVTVATVTGATNASPIVITTGTHGLGSGQVVRIKDVMGNLAANGTFYVTVVSSTTFSLYSDAARTVPVAGSGTYNSGGTVQTGVATITYGNLAVSGESKVVRRQVLRNKDGDVSTFYIDIDTTDLTSTSLNSHLTSADLDINNAVPLFDNNGVTLVDKTVPPDHKKLTAQYIGRMFAFGNEPYTEGGAAVTNGSKTVTGLGTEWGVTTFPGRFIEFAGGNKTYEIESVESTTSLTLTEAYSGTTDPYAYYKIHNGDGEKYSVYYTPAQEPEAWPVAFNFVLDADSGDGEITGGMRMGSWLYLLYENRIRRFSAVSNPDPFKGDGFSVPGPSRGCVNNRCWWQVDGVAYLMDKIGFSLFYGNDSEGIGSPQVQDIFRARPSGRYRINWNGRAKFHCVYDPNTTTMMWFVCLNGATTPYHAVCYQIRDKRWWIEEFAYPIGCSCLGRLNGKPQVFLGSSAKRVFAYGASVLDGPVPTAGTVRGTVTSSALDWIADSSATFASAGLVGSPLIITQGKGKGQRRNIRAVSGTKLYVDLPWLNLPDTTSVYQVGGISWKLRTGWMRWADAEYEGKRAIEIQSKPTQTQAAMSLRLYRDLAATASTWQEARTLNDANGIALLANDPNTDLSIDCTKTTGVVTQRCDSFREWYSGGSRFVAIELSGVPNQETQSIFGMNCEGMQ